MNIGKKELLATFVMCSLLITTVAVFSMNTGYVVGLHEGIGLNRNEAPIIGYYTVTQTDKEGNVHTWAFHNLITNAARLAICDYLGNDAYLNGNATTRSFHWIAIGTGSGQGAGDNALAVEAFRGAGSYDDSATAYNFTISYTFPATTFSGETITEFGVFNLASTGVMLSYHSDAGRTLGVDDSLQVVVEFMISV